MAKGPSLAQQAKLAQLRIEASKEPDLITSRQLADRLGVHPVTIAKWRMAGEGPRHIPISIGNKPRVRYRMADVLLWEQEIRGKQIEKVIAYKTRKKWEELMEQEAREEQKRVKAELVEAAISGGEDGATAVKEGVGQRIGDSIIDAAREAIKNRVFMGS